MGGVATSVINVEGQTYCIEVKSSQGADESFRLGSSEIELAMRLARQPKKRRRKEEFRVLCVMNALSAAPSFRLLPNPYDPKFQSQFVIEDAEARVRYRVAEEEPEQGHAVRATEGAASG